MRGNIAGDGTSATFRHAATNSTLSPWLTYNATIDGTSVISLSSSPQMGYAVAVTDPDNTPVAEQPDRLLVRVTGYGPKGSIRKMEVMISRFILTILQSRQSSFVAMTMTPPRWVVSKSAIVTRKNIRVTTQTRSIKLSAQPACATGAFASTEALSKCRSQIS